MSKALWSAIIVVGVLAIAVITLRSTRHAPVVAGPDWAVPRADAPITIDGKPDEPIWAHAARSGAFVCEGARVCAYADARALWDERHLYVMLYAADEEIRAAKVGPDGPVWLGDHFELVLLRGGRTFRIDVSPRAVLADAERGPPGWDTRWQSAAVAAIDTDGTIDLEGDQDEEWIAELAIPWAALGGAPQAGEVLGASVERCDVSRGEGRRCSRFGSVGAAARWALDARLAP